MKEGKGYPKGLGSTFLPLFFLPLPLFLFFIRFFLSLPLPTERNLRDVLPRVSPAVFLALSHHPRTLHNVCISIRFSRQISYLQAAATFQLDQRLFFFFLFLFALLSILLIYFKPFLPFLPFLSSIRLMFHVYELFLD